MTGRRTLIGIVAAMLLGVLAPQALAGVTVETRDTRLSVDLTGAVDKTTTIAAGASLPEQATGIGPGSHLLTTIPGEGTSGCTASFVYASGSDLFLAAAGHCFLPPGEVSTHRTSSPHSTDGTVVKVCVSGCSFGGLSGFILTGTLATLGDVGYARQESEGGRQVGHDFGLVRIPTSLHSQVRTSVPVFGGPTSTGTLQTGELVCHYGNGVAVGEVFPTMGRSGAGLFSDADAWFAATAAAPGDSGSAVQTCTPSTNGLSGVELIGTLTHITGSGIAGTTNAQSIQMAGQDAGLSILPVLASGTTTSTDTTTDGGGKGGKGGPKR